MTELATDGAADTRTEIITTGNTGHAAARTSKEKLIVNRVLWVNIISIHSWTLTRVLQI